MTTLPGLASKGEKEKPKFQSLDINKLYRVSRGESLEPHAAKSTLPRKHGMQSLGKVPSARRPPANLPSLKAETSNSSDTTAVSLVPAASGGTLGTNNQGATWGKSPVEASSNSSTPTTNTPAQNTAISPVKTAAAGPSGLSSHQAAIALPVTNTILPQATQSKPVTPDRTSGASPSAAAQAPPTYAPPSANTNSGDTKSWSAIMSGSEMSGGGQPPPYQSAQFQHEFPSLSGNVSTAESSAPGIAQRGGVDTQYGPGPSLRPQTEGSWMQGGCGGPAAAAPLEGASSAQQASAPAGHHILPQPLQQFRGVIPPFMYKGNFPVNNGPGINPLLQQSAANNFHSAGGGGGNTSGGTLQGPMMSGTNAPPAGAGGTRTSGMLSNRYRSGALPGGPPPAFLDNLAQRPIIKEEDLNKMEDMTRDSGWALNDDIDYNQQIVFSDDEQGLEPERKENSRQSSVQPKESEKPQEEGGKVQPSSGNWTFGRSVSGQSEGRHHTTSTGSRGERRSTEDEEVWSQRRKQLSEDVALAVERAKQRKEEEEKRFIEQREAASKKLQALEKRIKEKKTIDGKAFEESQGTINPAVVPPQVINPVPIPVPDWANRDSRERNDRDRESEPRGNVDQLEVSEFRQLTQIEGRSLHRNETSSSARERDRDRDRTDLPPPPSRDSMNRSERERDREMREQREGPNFSRSFQTDLPPRFRAQQERQRMQSGGGGGSGGSSGGSALNSSTSKTSSSNNANYSQSTNSSTNIPFAQQYEPRWNQPTAPVRRHRNDSNDDDYRRYSDDRYNRGGGGMMRGGGTYPDEGRKDSRDLKEFGKEKERESREREILDNRYYDDYPRNRNSQEYEYEKRGKDTSDNERKERNRDRQFDDREETKRDDYRDNVSDERRSVQYERDRDREDNRCFRDERPQRPDSRDSRESRHSRDSIRDLDNSREYTGSWADERAPFEEEKRKDYKDDRDRRVPGPITREKMEADELRNEKRNLTQLKRSASGQGLDKKLPEMKKIEEKVMIEKKPPAVDEDWIVPKKENVTSEMKENKAKEDDLKIEKKADVKEDVKKNEKEDVGKEKDEKRRDNRSHNRTRDNRDRRDRWAGSSSGGGGGGVGSYSVYRGSGWSSGSGGSSGRRGPPSRVSSHRSGRGEWKQTDSELSADEISVSTESGKDDRGSQRQQQPPRSPKPTKKSDKDEKNLEVKQEKGFITTNDRRFEKSAPRGYENQRAPSGNSAREGFPARGEPSRRGRGGGAGYRSSRGSSSSKRMDGYGPPSTKSPFGSVSQYQVDSDKEKKTSGDEISGDAINVDEKSRKESKPTGVIGGSRNQSKGSGGGSSSQVPPRMQKKSDAESHRDQSKGRGTSRSRNRRSKSRGKAKVTSDEYAETTSDNSDGDVTEHGRKISAGSKSGGSSSSAANQQAQRQNSTGSSASNQNRSRSGSQSHSLTSSSSRAPGAEKRSSGNSSYQGRSSQSQAHRQNSGSNLRGSKSIKESVNEGKEKETDKKDEHIEDGGGGVLENNIGDDVAYQPDSEGFQEVRSKKNAKPTKDDKEKFTNPSSKKTEKEIVSTGSSRGGDRSKSSSTNTNKPNGPIIQSNIPPLMGTPVTPPTKSQFDRQRQKNVPPRFMRQRENNARMHKVQMQMCDVNEMNKINQSVSMYSASVKDGSPGSIANAWEKTDTLNMAIDKCVDLDHQQSGTSSQRSSPTDKGIKMQDKSVLDGSTPPVNTIIFENTNYKSTPATNDLSMKSKFNMKNSQRMEKNRTNKLEDADIDSQTMLAFTKPIDMLEKKSESALQLPLSFNKAEDSADMKLDFNFDSDLQLTDDKNTKVLGLPRSMHAMTSAQSTISPSTAELNLKIASVKKVWEKSMPPVMEHSVGEDGTNNTSTGFATLDASVAFSKNDPSDESHEVYSPSPSHVSTNNTNVCKVKPTQQTSGNGSSVNSVAAAHHIGGPGASGVPNPAGTPLGPAQAQGVAGQQPNNSHLGSSHTLSPPPVQAVMGLGQPPQAYTASANQHLNYQPNLAGNAQFGGMSAIPSPPTVPFNISPHPSQGSLYTPFQMDQGRSQFSQFPPAAYGIGQTASTPYNQSVYLQTGPPHPPPSAQHPPDVYQSLTSQYRMAAATGPFGQSQQLNNNPSTVLISSTSNSLMSASVKPSSQPIGAIGTKAGAIGQGYGTQSQGGQQVYLPYDPSLQPSYLRGPGGPVQSNVVPAAIQSNSYYSANAGGQTGYFQQPGNSALPSAPPALHQHQTNFGLQTNVFSGSVHSGSTAGALQNFNSQFLSSQLQIATALQQQRQYGTAPGGGVPPSAVQQQQNARPQQIKSPAGQTQQDMLASVFNSVLQQQHQPPQQNQQQANNQQQSQGGRQAQNQMGMGLSGRSQSLSGQGGGGQPGGGAARYPTPIQRPISIQAPQQISMSGSSSGGNSNGGQRGQHRSAAGQQSAMQGNQQQGRNGPATHRQQYYGGGQNQVPTAQEKNDEMKLNSTNSSTSQQTANSLSSSVNSVKVAVNVSNAVSTTPNTPGETGNSGKEATLVNNKEESSATKIE